MIVRTPQRDRYTIIANAAIEDTRLSWKARGILLYLLSKFDGWEVRIGDIVKHGPDGRKAVIAGLNELERHGYLRREQQGRHHSGQFDDRKTFVFETPQYGTNEQRRNVPTSEDAISPVRTVCENRSTVPTVSQKGFTVPPGDIDITPVRTVSPKPRAVSGTVIKTDRANTERTSITEAERDELFSLLRGTYPEKRGSMPKQREALAVALAKIDASSLLSAVDRYAAYIYYEDKIPKYLEHWLPDERWTDEYDTDHREFNIGTGSWE